MSGKQFPSPFIINPGGHCPSTAAHFGKPGSRRHSLSGCEVVANDPQRRYHKTIELPQDADIETAKSTYNNGVLEITISKKKSTKPKGKEIKID